MDFFWYNFKDLFQQFYSQDVKTFSKKSFSYNYFKMQLLLLQKSIKGCRKPAYFI